MIAFATNNQFRPLCNDSSEDNSDLCIAHDCNLQQGEIRPVRCKTNTMAFTGWHRQTTTAYISAPTTTTYTDFHKGQLMSEWLKNTIGSAATYEQQSQLGKEINVNMNTGDRGRVVQTPTATTSPTMPKEMPENFNMSTMYKMLAHISQQVAVGNSEMAAMRQLMTMYTEQIETVKQDVEDQQKVIDETVVNFNKCVDTIQTLSSIAIQQGKEI